MDMQYTGNKITALRKEKGWTQKEVAERLHVSIAAVSKWERGLNTTIRFFRYAAMHQPA